MGTIEQRVASAHNDELHLNIEVLAQECDHAEYVLTVEYP